MVLLFGFKVLLVGAIWICLASGATPPLKAAAFPPALLTATTASVGALGDEPRCCAQEVALRAEAGGVDGGERLDHLRLA